MPVVAPSADKTSHGVHGFDLVISLWLCTLIISIMCAIRALLLLKSVKKRTPDTSPCQSLPDQARNRIGFAIRIEWANRTVLALYSGIVFSLSTFLSGFIVYVFYVDDPLILLIPLPIIIGYPSLCLFNTINNTLERRSHHHRTPLTQKKAQEQRFEDYVLERTLDMSRSDDDLEQFMDAILGFCASKIVDNPRHSLDALGLPRLAEALIEFWNCTLSSNRIEEAVKVRRLVICVRVIEATDLSIAISHILHLLLGDLSGVSRSIEIGHFLRPLRNGNAASLARGIIASIISNAERNERWFTLAMDELDLSEDVLQYYLKHDNSVLLANIIHITRHFFHGLLQHHPDLTQKSSSILSSLSRFKILHGLLQPHPDLTQKSSSILSSLSRFNILNTLPKLQHEFCDLWNEVVQQARSSEGDDNPFIDILVQIRYLYDVLHGTDIPLRHFGYSTTGHDDLFHQPPPYPFLIPFCMMSGHHPEPTTHAHEASGSTTGGASQTITTTSDTLSESSPGDLHTVSHHTATGMGISQGIDDNSILSMAEPITQSSEGITVSSMVFDSPVNRSDFMSPILLVWQRLTARQPAEQMTMRI